MRFIEDSNLRNKYKGQEILIAGSGPSLDDFPDNFFDDKIVITVNMSCLGIPNATFHSCVHALPLKILRDKYPDLYSKFLPKFICFCPVDCTHDSLGRPYNQTGQYGEIPIYAKSAIGGHSKERFITAVKEIMAGKSTVFRSFGTSSHPPIQAAVVLGAKRVTLVGCEECARKFQYHAHRGEMRKILREPFKEYPQEWQEGKARHSVKHMQGQIWLAEIFKSYGIEIQRYFYGKGYESII